ncbi:MAG: thioredoxin-disulfide reductase [Desulfobacterales bacterium]
MSQSEIFDLVIIGGGPGGLTAAIYAMRAALKTVLIERGVPGGQINKSDAVENYPGFVNISGSELSMKFAQHARVYGIEELNDEATVIEPGLGFHTVRTAGGRNIQTHAVILASGGLPRKLNIPGEDEYYGRGVSCCAVCDGFFFRGKNVVVVGGGDAACEEGLYLAKLAAKVYLIHRRDALRASMILQKRVEAECKMEVLWNTVITEIKVNADGVNAVTLQDTQIGNTRNLPIDGVFIYIGFDPNNQLVPAGIRMSPEGFVITNDQCATNINGIYAVGDLREKYARQIVLAAADGCMAALSAAHYVETRKAKMQDPTCVLPE